MHPNDWSFTDGYCKIKTARQKKRLLKEDFDKQLIQLYKLRDGLCLQKRTLPLIPLEEPYQRGWIRTFVLRDDIAKSRLGSFYQTLLSKINTVEHSHEKAFKRKKRKHRKKIYEVRPQYLREFYTWEWNHPKCKLTDAEKVHFHWKEYWNKDGKTKTMKLVFNEPWRYVLKVKPYMITHTRKVDERLESQIQQLDNYIERNHLNHKMTRLIHGQSYNPWRGTENERQRNPLKNKPLYKILEAVANDDL